MRFDYKEFQETCYESGISQLKAFPGHKGVSSAAGF
jgi:hypothetical protein